LRAAALIGVGPLLCVAVEDSHKVVPATHAAGMLTEMVPDILPPNEQIRGLCLAGLNDLHALRGLLHAGPL
jgi:beta-phosphoglucomutase-like phosphatase (HAD superfamily)